MPQEWEKVKEALRQPADEESRKRAAEAFREYEGEQKRLGKRSKPAIVTLGLRKTYPHTIPLDEVPGEIERNPEFYELMQRVVAKGTK